MPTCPSCGHFFSQNLTQHLVNSECKGSVEKQLGRIASIKLKIEHRAGAGFL